MAYSPYRLADADLKRCLLCLPKDLRQILKEEPGIILRAIKYARRGYHISPESLAAVIQRAMKGIDAAEWPASNPDDQEKLILGVLSEVDPSVPMDGIVEFDEAERNLVGE